MHSKIVTSAMSALLALSMFAVSAPVQAAQLTSGQVNAIIMLLQSFGADPGVVSSVQATLTGGTSSGSTTWMGSTTSPLPPGLGQGGMPPGQIGKDVCIALNRNLGPGSRGDDVKSLQELLAEDPSTGFTATPNGFFGPMTLRAMMHFQMNNGIASTSSASGFVGPMTRGFFERHCGEGLGNGNGGQEGDHGGPGMGGPGGMGGQGDDNEHGRGMPPPPPPPPINGTTTATTTSN